MRLIWDGLAAIGLVAMIGFAVFGVLNLVPKLDAAYQAKPKTVGEAAFIYPLPYDATVCQRGAAPDKWKCRGYMRNGR